MAKILMETSQPRPWLVTGMTGQVGRSLLKLLQSLQTPAIGVSSRQLDLAHPEKLEEVLEAWGPIRGILNPAAFTAVDLAEDQTELARRINAQSPPRLARFCFDRNLPFLHFSTDYVYSGAGTTPWKESDAIDPQNAYGRSKAEGDQQIQNQAEKFPEARWAILRTSWVYDSEGNNFPRKILAKALEQSSLQVVSDQYGAPTHSDTLAKAACDLLHHLESPDSAPLGVLHACSQGVTTWHGFASRIVERAKQLGMPIQCTEIVPVPTGTFPTRAQRPKNSRLDLSRIESLLGRPLPCWEDDLEHFFHGLKPTQSS